MRRVVSLLALATAVAGCESKTADSANIPLDQVPRAAAGGSAATANALTGAVLEQLAASPYVYLRLKTANGEVWAAVPETKVEKGASVTVYSPMLMNKFESKSLKRTFDEVYFGSLSAPAGDAAMGAGASADPHAGAASTTPSFDVGKVEKASGANARTVAEIWAQKSTLEGKTVTIRGKVVRYNEGVMARNWIHLQDGSGTLQLGNNDVTVTSADVAAVGETVTVTGTVRTNKDFGVGYTYAVIVEDAKVVKK